MIRPCFESIPRRDCHKQAEASRNKLLKRAEASQSKLKNPNRCRFWCVSIRAVGDVLRSATRALARACAAGQGPPTAKLPGLLWWMVTRGRAAPSADCGEAVAVGNGTGARTRQRVGTRASALAAQGEGLLLAGGGGGAGAGKGVWVERVSAARGGRTAAGRVTARVTARVKARVTWSRALAVA